MSIDRILEDESRKHGLADKEIVSTMQQLLKTTESGELFQACAAVMSTIRKEELRKAGGKQAPYWRGPKAPDADQHWNWADHHTTITTPLDKKLYVSEPYDLQIEDLRELVEFADSGYTVWITGRSTYYPGETLAVNVMAKAA